MLEIHRALALSLSPLVFKILYGECGHRWAVRRVHVMGPPRINCNKTIAGGSRYERVFHLPDILGAGYHEHLGLRTLGNAGQGKDYLLTE
jgi:hypothetical protein